MSELDEGMRAPDFDLPRDGGGNVSMKDLSGKKVVLYFYPKDDTSGCTIQAVDFTALAAEFDDAGAIVVGMSPDPVKAHDKFIAKHDLGIILASDTDKSVLQAYGVWKEKSMYGRTYMGVERSTFLIDSDGTIARIWRRVKPKGHAQTVLEAVRSL
ncbi:thioredoxin-dependent thiol peroxidase [Hoeflea sp. YIM 152468]|uniref:thioredoxin-dependent thiol peroxidase n=1 Tax=Hoeflea sp. YIM 152468 TaxID=3031759 RepID=UPI0023DB62AE|nr:thioredoxin-dependent thiol peroxidase [Hoeflea sp. YIM 152468]MDF1607490.1 thioredoxin-dependent thiol peroxidase [Hoeflea sp. YIM 152468]